MPAALDQASTYVLLEQEDWFEDEIRFVRHWLQPGMRAVDVGANIGVYTVAMARAVGSAGRVWAFEPTPAAADYLQRSLGLNGIENVIVSRCAVSERAGRVEFSSGADSALNAIRGAGNGAGNVLQVGAVTLDQEAIDRDWGNTDFIKMDVEGHELAVVKGGTAFFRSASPLVMLEVKVDDRFDPAALDLLAELGYDIYRLLPEPLMLEPFDRFDALDQYALNLFACKADRARNLADGGYLSGAGIGDAAKPAKGVWGAFARSAPYARDLAAHWRAGAGLFSASDVGTYFRGLAAFAQSRDAKLPAAERLAWLNLSLQHLADALEANDTLARRLSYARLAAALGWRRAAVDCLRIVRDRMAVDGATALQEPFLAPSVRYEQLAPGGAPLDWLKCAVVEQFERLRAYSSLYTGTTALGILDPIRDLPMRSPEMDRRRNLVRLRSGFLERPEPSPLLLADSDENLNSGFWAARA